MVVKTSNKNVFYKTALNKVVNLFSKVKWFLMHKMNYNLHWQKYVWLKLRNLIVSFLNKQSIISVKGRYFIEASKLFHVYLKIASWQVLCKAALQLKMLRASEMFLRGMYNNNKISEHI